MQNVGEVRRRISINGGKFREYINGQQDTVHEGALNVVATLNAGLLDISTIVSYEHPLSSVTPTV